MIDKTEEKVNSNAAMLKYLRESLGMTQKELANELGVVETTIWRAENGRNEMKFTFSQMKRVFKLMTRAGIPIDKLPDGPDQPATG
jgi:transcriptional regulator with XRE-family HTH domain